MRDITKLITEVKDQHAVTRFIVRTFERDSSAMREPPPRFHVTTVRNPGVGGAVVHEEAESGSVFVQHTEAIAVALEIMRRKK